MATLQELLAQRRELEAAIEKLQSANRAKAINEIKQLMAEHGLTMADIADGNKTRKSGQRPDGSPKQVVAAKYRNATTGETWSGRGLKPKWLSAAIEGGATLESFAI